MKEANASNYAECAALAETRKRKLDNNTYLIVHDDHYAIKLHKTEIVKHYPGHTELYTGGWKTVTTKDRINKFSRVSISQSKGVWYVTTGFGTVTFSDGMVIDWDAQCISGAGEDPKEQIAWRKKANQYAKDYAAALLAGKIPAPSGGDCWACYFVADDGSSPMGGPDHMKSHIEENYFVPSIMLRVADRLSPVVKYVTARIWAGEKTPEIAGLCAHQIQSAVRWYALHELGLAT
jgi:hypothetical protein